MQQLLLSDSPLCTAIFDFSSHQSTVLEGLNALRKNKKLIDVSLIVEGRAFQAHKVVLSASSDYFHAMFTCDMVEATKTDIQLNGVGANGFSHVLEYVYTGKITLNLVNILDVLDAASHLQIIVLTDICSSYLEGEIDLDNCVDITTIAETYSLDRLQKQVYRFMSENLSSFSNTKEFLRLNAGQLEKLLSFDLPVDCSEADVLKIVLNWIRCNINLKSAVRIFRHVHFGDIPKRKLISILSEVIESGKCEWELYRLLMAEIYNQIVEAKGRKPTPQLLNGRGMELAVLKIGGFGIGGITNDITYKFESKTEWKHLTKIPHVEQCNFGTAVLNNELFIIGGCFNQGMQEHVHPFGFRYNPLRNKWSTMAPMQKERCRFSLNVLNGTIFAVGGFTEYEESDSSTASSCESYNPDTDQWWIAAPLPVSLTQHAGASVEQPSNSKLFVCGGMDRDIVQNGTFCYDPIFNEWSTCAPMLTARADHVMLAIDGLLYVCGGWREDFDTGARVLVDTLDVYDVEKDEWTIRTKVPTPRFHAGIVSIYNKIYVVGGFKRMFDRDTAAIECYDIENDIWTIEEKYPEEVWEHVCTALYLPK